MWAAVLFLLLAPEQPLNNANVGSMVALGLPESSIVLAIQLAGQRGNVDFDTSPAALVALKNEGATANILNAMLAAQAEKAVPGLPFDTGLYFQTPSGWVPLESFVFWPSFLMPDLSRKPRDVAVPVPRPRLRTDVRRPVFHARSLDAGARWEFLKLLPKNELRVAWSGGFPPQVQIDAREVIPAEVAAVSGGVFTVRPAWTLEGGDFLVCNAVPGGRDVFQCRAFTVAPTR